MVPIGEIVVVVVGSMNMTDRLWVKFPFIFDENLRLYLLGVSAGRKS